MDDKSNIRFINAHPISANNATQVKQCPCGVGVTCSYALVAAMIFTFPACQAMCASTRSDDERPEYARKKVQGDMLRPTASISLSRKLTRVVVITFDALKR
mgnify:CR=1 FL=1